MSKLCAKSLEADDVPATDALNFQSCSDASTGKQPTYAALWPSLSTQVAQTHEPELGWLLLKGACEFIVAVVLEPLTPSHTDRHGLFIHDFSLYIYNQKTS